VDDKWRDHLYDLDQLREGIYYRAWGQKDPLVEYKQEAFEMFKGLMDDLRITFTERWLKLQVEVGPPGPPSGMPRAPSRPVTGPAGGLPGGPRRQTSVVASKAAADGLVTDGEPPPPSVQRGARGVAGGVAEPAFAANPYAGVGRNDPCPCGSGKKFKKCHGAAM